MNKKRLIFDYLKQKHASNLNKISLLNFLIILLLVLSLLTVFITAENIFNNILNNKQLSIVFINGYGSDDGEYEYDTDLISQQPYVKDLSYEYQISLETEVDGIVDFVDCHSLNPTTRDAIQFNDEIADNAIVFPESFKDKNFSLFDMNREPINYQAHYYDGDGQLFLRDLCYISPPLYEKIFDQVEMGYNYSGVKNLLVNVGKTERIFDFVNEFETLFDEENVFIYYQAQGLEHMISQSKMSFYLLLAFQIVLLFIIINIYRNSLKYLINLVNKDLLTLYLNGLSERHIIKEFYRLIERINTKIYIASYLIIIIIGIIFYNNIAFSIFLKLMIALIISVTLIILANRIIIYRLISHQMKQELASDNIVAQLRN